MHLPGAPWGALTAALSLAILFTPGLTGCSDDDGDSCEGVLNACDTADDTQCGGSGVQTCEANADGCLVWTDTETCLTGFTCVNAACVCDDACADGESQCAGNVVQLCEQGTDGCWQWADDVDCADTGESCDDTAAATCVSGAGCGNDLVEGTEVCDGSDLDSQTCVTRGYASGTLDCNSTCTAFDETGCVPTTNCGNDIIDVPEVCDGTALNSQTCVTRGYLSGTLACNGSCTAFDETNCVPTTGCGNDIIDGTEVCDGTDLDSQTCVTRGFGGGILDCNGSCTAFDETGCTAIVVEICDNNIDDNSNGAADCADASCIGHATCDMGYNFDFEDWTASNPPTRYDVSSASDATFVESTTIVNTGTSATMCHWTTSSNRDLIHQLLLPVTVGTEYTVHTWMYDNDPTGRARPAIDWIGAGNSFDNLYSADSTLWQEVTITQVAPAGATAMAPFLRLYDQAGFDPVVGATVYTDDWAVTEHHAFTAGPTPDSDTTQAANDGGAGFVNVAVNDEGVLYLETQAGANGTSDRAVLIWVDGVDTTATVAAPWAKAGVVDAPVATGWLLAFMDEGDSSFCGWWVWDTGTVDWVQLTTDVACYDSFSDSGNLLSGWLDATAHLIVNPYQLPSTIHVASVAYGTADGGAVLSQMPAATTADDNITGDESVSLHRAHFLSGKIHP